MTKKFIALYDVIVYSIISAYSIMNVLYIMVFVKVGDFDWCVQNWHLVLLFSVSVALPVALTLFIQKIKIHFNVGKLEAHYLVNYAKNYRDLDSNWIIYLSEIESVEIVKLSKEEKRKYTSARFIFNKYLKVNLKYGHSKYLYVSHYSNSQIKKIIKILTKK